MYLRIFPVLLGFLFFSCAQKQSAQEKAADITEMEGLHKAGNSAKAKEEVEKYISKNQKNEYAWSLLGHIESELQNYEAAAKAYQKALEINKNTAQALTGLGILARKRGDYSKAADYYYASIKANAEYASAYSSLVVIELKRKNFKKAVEMGEKGYELDNTDPVIASNLSIAYHYLGDMTNRDRFYNIAKNLGYKNIEAINKIFSGELTVFD